MEITSPALGNAAPVAPPATLGDNLVVIGAIPQQSGTGQHCHLWVGLLHVTDADAAHAYGTAEIGCGGGPGGCGRPYAIGGHYDMTWPEAAEDMVRRAAGRP